MIRISKKALSLQSYSRVEHMDQEKFSLLSKIKYPDDLRKLSIDQLPQVCKELREDIIDEVAVNPGHFASSLGVVEITVALHYVFNTPEDRIVWDVGHQAYGHKILTGRRDSFCTNRKLHGIRPFPSPLESEYDTFACGHASNSTGIHLSSVGYGGGSQEDGQGRQAYRGGDRRWCHEWRTCLRGTQ